jgi:hypothetical protein
MSTTKTTKDWSDEENAIVTFGKSCITSRTPIKTNSTSPDAAMATKKDETTFLLCFPDPPTAIQKTTPMPMPTGTKNNKDTVNVCMEQPGAVVMERSQASQQMDLRHVVPLKKQPGSTHRHNKPWIGTDSVRPVREKSRLTVA